ncbi:Probable small nuclear ribonucleoprotein G [Olea europaea subsp. europaea]|uniref:Probable small nuclear ribonucleoprotein G n=1 Tax=Olea europaea subsp. europaea TaxID=158383 RepID=A0A8S0PFP4_OLEEU|nr:Probable small nuclear ribonucleoprotein G [Olea europaea subsp. europaea]
MTSLQWLDVVALCRGHRGDDAAAGGMSAAPRFGKNLVEARSGTVMVFAAVEGNAGDGGSAKCARQPPLSLLLRDLNNSLIRLSVNLFFIQIPLTQSWREL